MSDFPSDLEEYQILKFLNSVKTIEEITAAFELPGKTSAGVQVVPNFFELKTKIGKFVSLDQVCHVLQVHYSKISELVSILRDKGLVD